VVGRDDDDADEVNSLIAMEDHLAKQRETVHKKLESRYGSSTANSKQPLSLESTHHQVSTHHVS